MCIYSLFYWFLFERFSLRVLLRTCGIAGGWFKKKNRIVFLTADSRIPFGNKWSSIKKLLGALEYEKNRCTARFRSLGRTNGGQDHFVFQKQPVVVGRREQKAKRMSEQHGNQPKTHRTGRL